MPWDLLIIHLRRTTVYMTHNLRINSKWEGEEEEE
jgi:hypothetical protein